MGVQRTDDDGRVEDTAHQPTLPADDDGCKIKQNQHLRKFSVRVCPAGAVHYGVSIRFKPC